jgi:hypothetical protein
MVTVNYKDYDDTVAKAKKLSAFIENGLWHFLDTYVTLTVNIETDDLDEAERKLLSEVLEQALHTTMIDGEGNDIITGYMNQEINQWEFKCKLLQIEPNFPVDLMICTGMSASDLD